MLGSIGSGERARPIVGEGAGEGEWCTAGDRVIDIDGSGVMNGIDGDKIGVLDGIVGAYDTAGIVSLRIIGRCVGVSEGCCGTP